MQYLADHVQGRVTIGHTNMSNNLDVHRQHYVELNINIHWFHLIFSVVKTPIQNYMLDQFTVSALGFISFYICMK